jgi:hypothetical protein
MTCLGLGSHNFFVARDGEITKHLYCLRLKTPKNSQRPGRGHGGRGQVDWASGRFRFHTCLCYVVIMHRSIRWDI